MRGIDLMEAREKNQFFSEKNETVFTACTKDTLDFRCTCQYYDTRPDNEKEI